MVAQSLTPVSRGMGYPISDSRTDLPLTIEGTAAHAGRLPAAVARRLAGSESERIRPASSRRPAMSSSSKASSTARRAATRRSDGGSEVRLGREERDARDSASQFLAEIGRFPLLTREEEVALSVIVHDEAAEEDERQAARDRLVECNLRLVVSIAKDFTRGGLFPIMDLVSVGQEGLMVASRKFDGTRGVPFANYAASWIKQRLFKYTAESGMAVKVPPYKAPRINKILRAHCRLQAELGRAPHPEEVVAATTAADEAVFARTGKYPATRITVADVQEWTRLMQPAVELDAPLGGADADSTYGGYFGPSSQEADETLDAKLAHLDRVNAVKRVLGALPEREQFVLAMCYGLNGHRPQDLDQIGQALRVTRERVRQIREKALKTIRQDPALFNALRVVLG